MVFKWLVALINKTKYEVNLVVILHVSIEANFVKKSYYAKLRK